MKKTVIVIRDGEIKLRVPNAEIRNGIIRVGKNILINGDKIVAPHTKESVAASIKAGKTAWMGRVAFMVDNDPAVTAIKRLLVLFYGWLRLCRAIYLELMVIYPISTVMQAWRWRT